LGIFWRALEWTILIHFMIIWNNFKSVWYILWSMVLWYTNCVIVGEHVLHVSLFCRDDVIRYVMIYLTLPLIGGWSVVAHCQYEPMCISGIQYLHTDIYLICTYDCWFSI
jgi:hypothetical protein